MDDKCCMSCGEETNKTVRINEDDGFCKSPSRKPLCPKCFDPILLGDNYFCNIKGIAYYLHNAYLGMFRTLTRLYSRKQIDYLINERKNKFLENLK